MTIGNVKIKFHFSIFILILFLIWQIGSAFATVTASLLASLIVIFILYASVFIHEMAHAKTAEWFGYRTKDITLWALGGAANMPDIEVMSPKEELIVAAAGPALSFVLAALAATIAFALGINLLPPEIITTLYAPFIVICLFWYNILIGVFNLLPAFPMDGGRIVRATLSMFLPRLIATKIALYISMLCAILMVVFGFFTQSIILPIIGILVFITGLATLAKIKKEYTQS